MEQLATEDPNEIENKTENEDVERVSSKIAEESKNNNEKILEDNETVEEVSKSLRNSDDPLEVKFNLEANEEIEDESSLPPLPPPKKLLKYQIPPILQPVPKENNKVPPEIIGQGINRKVS